MSKGSFYDKLFFGDANVISKWLKGYGIKEVTNLSDYFRACILFASNQEPRDGQIHYYGPAYAGLKLGCFYGEMFQEAGKRLLGKEVVIFFTRWWSIYNEIMSCEKS